MLAKWEFYRVTSRKNCRRTHYCDLATLVLAAVGPAMTVIVNRPVIGALIGVGVVITSGARGIYRWDQNWISRAVAGPYDGDSARAVLVRTVQQIADAEGRVWERERRRTAAGKREPVPVKARPSPDSGQRPVRVSSFGVSRMGRNS